ncbi:hypothetical protein [Romboutsia sp. 1001713B170207_170306_H8]|uniref:hypothetical protein n=2 Tax=unclassified Romboutsia TaxID=2626894 RepID=UPI00082211BC|nr:hypothetical protein [Romboutsia sp. 1001713B170207_170306_H8]SCH29904.1 Uncharacterised protein [uncultured Clostridium sp.]
MKFLYNIRCQKNKNKKVIDKYLELINLNHNQSRKILLLVPNNMTKLEYERRVNLEYSEELKITTYLNFVKNELIKYWPIIIKNCEDIKSNSICPIFISNNLSDYIISNEVKKKRNLEGYFSDITSTDRGIISSISTNINKAALSLIEFTTIGDRLYLSKKNKDKILKFSYSQMNEIINYYTETLLSAGIVDNSISIYLYNKYLLSDNDYIKNLEKNINYIIVDSLESCSSAEVDFIDIVSSFAKDSYVYFNSSRDYSSFNNIDMEYIREKIIKTFINAKVENTNELVGNINLEDLYLKNVDIELNQGSQLYSQMIQEVTNKIIDLVNSNIKPKDIVILSPINNNILDYQVKYILDKYNIGVINTKKDKKIVDYPYANALIVAACIFYDYEQLIKEEEYISFIETVFETNRIQAFKIFRDKENNENYQELIEYIKRYKSENIKIYEFLMRFYIDKMLSLKEGKLNVRICRHIIQESEIFTDNINLLNLDKNKSKEKIFIDVLKTTIKDYYLSKEIQDIKESNKIIISTPYSYITSNLDRKVQLWVDIGSNAWNMKIEKDISNVIVLRKSYNENKIYTDDMEEGYKKYYLYNMIYNLLDSAKKVYAYKSDYTVNGYMQESILYSLLLKLVDKGGE